VSSEIWHHVGFQRCVKIFFGSLLVLNLCVYIENIDFPTGFSYRVGCSLHKLYRDYLKTQSYFVKSAITLVLSKKMIV
jgi:hypothetical protein